MFQFKLFHPSKRKFTLIWGVIIALSFWRFYLSATLPLTPDEAYYSLWAMRLQGGYFDHPYMVALWIKIGLFLGALFGYGLSPFFVRILGVSSVFIGSFIFYDTAYNFFKDKIKAIWAVGFLNITVFYGLVTIIITPDIPQIFFILMILWSLSHLYSEEHASKEHSSKAHRFGQFHLWRLFWSVLLGISLGCGGASKYTMILFIPSLLGIFLFDKKDFWKRKTLYSIPFLAVLPVLPVLIWNYHHHWAGFLKQGNRLTDWHPVRAMQFLLELIAGQMGLITPLLFIISFYGLWRIRKEYPLFLWLILPALCVFIFHAFGDRVQANWPSIIYPPLILIAGWMAGRMKKFQLYIFWSGAIILIALSLQVLGKGVMVSAHYDPIARQMVGWEIFAKNLQKEAMSEGAEMLDIEDYALASILCRQNSWHFPIISHDRRWSYLKDDSLFKGKFKGEFKGKNIFSVSEVRNRELEKNRVLIPRKRDGQILRYYLLEKEEILEKAGDNKSWRVPFCGNKAK